MTVRELIKELSEVDPNMTVKLSTTDDGIAYFDSEVESVGINYEGDTVFIEGS